ncbi:MAG: class III poly(R)-hydroxyalkanoic acid synthase subunit PhaE [Proteobacteria bacterium]|nr:class III poly(R)-hydroxyalkanoic acid synthase subunit PhaE [Pseudomonadota bacterium]
MSENKTSQDWQKDWQALQQQYWNAWQDATRGVPNQPGANAPWHEGLEQWSRLFAGSGKQNETTERLLGSAKAYVALMQSMLAATAGKDAGAGVQGAWTQALRDGFNLPGMGGAFTDNPFAAMMQGLRGPGAQGLGELPQAFAPFLAQAKAEGMSWLNAPAFGYAREHQERMQKAAVAFAEFQDAVGKYNELMLKSSQRSFAIFEDKLAQRGEPGRQIDSLRGLYDLWVDAAEEAYAEIALSDEFRKAYGDVVNAQMRVRSHVQSEVERLGAELGMPTRTELDSVHKRLHGLRRELRAPRGAESASAEIAALRSEVKALRESLRAKPAKPAAAAAVDPKRRAAPARKRVAAVAKPRKASRAGAGNFNDALKAMKDKSGSGA